MEEEEEEEEMAMLGKWNKRANTISLSVALTSVG
jgi:hypothetical protein